MLNVVCVNTGDYLGRGREYVAGLRAEVGRHLARPHVFTVVTDDDPEAYPGCRVIAARFGGWWEKIRLFEPGLFRGRVMFLDLDTFILGGIGHIADYDGPFATLHDFWRPHGLGPAVMLFDPEWARFIWDDWAAAGFPRENARGDQAWIEDRRQGRMRKTAHILQDLHPGEIVSYKTHCLDGPPPDARIVCFHGVPRPHEVRADAPGGWAAAHWAARLNLEEAA